MSKFSFALFVSLMNFLTRLGCQIIMYTKATRAGQEQKAKKSSSVAYFINDGVLGREREKALFGLCTKKNVYSFSRGSFVFNFFRMRVLFLFSIVLGTIVAFTIYRWKMRMEEGKKMIVCRLPRSETLNILSPQLCWTPIQTTRPRQREKLGVIELVSWQLAANI